MATLLLVDSDQRHLRDLTRLIRGDGHEGHGITDGRQGIRLTYRLRPDVVLIAVTPPSLDGIDICRELRQELPATIANRVPIILIGDRVDPVDCVVGLEVGADDYVTRPINRRELAARIKA